MHFYTLWYEYSLFIVLHSVFTVVLKEYSIYYTQVYTTVVVVIVAMTFTTTNQCLSPLTLWVRIRRGVLWRSRNLTLCIILVLSSYILCFIFNKAEGYWLGGYNVNEDGDLEWISNPGQTMSFNGMKSSQPNAPSTQRCLVSWERFSYQWADYECTYKLPYICEYQASYPAPI